MTELTDAELAHKLREQLQMSSHPHLTELVREAIKRLEASRIDPTDYEALAEAFNVGLAKGALLSGSDAAEVWGIDRRNFDRDKNNGKLPFIPVGRSVFFRPSVIEAWRDSMKFHRK